MGKPEKDAPEVSKLTSPAKVAAEPAAKTTTTASTTADTKTKEMAAAATEKTDEKQKITSTSPTRAKSVGSGNNDGEEQLAPLDATVISLSEGEDSLDSTKNLLVLGKKRKNRDYIPGEREYYLMKRRKLKVPGAPKMPLTGYVRYMNDRREVLRKERPEKIAQEHTRIISEEWASMSVPEKRPYLRAAALDKQKYLSELHVFLQEHPDVLASEMARNNGNAQGLLKEKVQQNGQEKNKGNKSKETYSTISSSNQQLYSHKRNRSPTPTVGGGLIPGEIPIYTKEFLEHNKFYDMDLRMMRKTKADLEQQNAVLEKHVENMKFGVEKMTLENDEYEEKTRLMGIYMQKLKAKMAHAFAGLAIPSYPHGATMENIDKYLAELHKMSSSNTHGPASLNKAKDILRKLDLEIHL